MSDTSNPGNLASAPITSAQEFDDRLRRADENRWLATRYAPLEGREKLVAIYLLHQELSRALHTKEAMLGKIRIQWWRETIQQVGGKGAVRRHDLAEELARVTRGRDDLIAPINDLIDRFDDVIDDHLHQGGHSDTVNHADRHFATEASLTQLAGRALDASATKEHLDILARAGEAHLAAVAELPDADLRRAAARKSARALPARLWPAILHASISDPPNTVRTPLSKRWRMFQAALTHRL